MGNYGFNQAFSWTSSGFGNGFSYGSPPQPPPPPPATLVLNYDFSNVACYPGTGSTVTDLVGNSNGTLYGSPAYDSGAITLNGTNQYLYTITSLNEKVPTDVTTIMMWAYPQDNGVLLAERGAGGLSSLWHDSQMEMVGGTMKFRMWNGPSVTSSVSVSMNTWYLFTMVYDGSTLYTYINGVAAGSSTFSRLRPEEGAAELHYAVGGPDTTSLGDGTYAKMKLGEFRVYNDAKSQADVLNYYNSTKSKWPNPPAVVQDHLELWFDSRYPASYPGSGTSWTDMKNSIVAVMSSGVTYDAGMKTMVFDGTSNAHADSPPYTSDLSTGYTLEAYVKWNTLPSYDGVVAYNQSPHYANMEYIFGGVRFEGGGSMIKDPVAPTTGVFYHYVCTWDGSNSRIYRDGTLVVGPLSAPQAQYNNHTAPWVMGHWDAYLSGAITMTRLYSKALSDAEVTQNYNATLAGP